MNQVILRISSHAANVKLAALFAIALSAAFAFPIGPAKADAGAQPAAGLSGDNPAADMSSYWTFDEGSGTSVYDYSGSGNSGTALGAVKWDVGKSGKCLYFNGKDSMVEIPDGPWNHGAPISFTLWYKAQNGGALLEHDFGGAVPGAYLLQANGFKFYDSQNHGFDGTARLAQNGDWNFAAITISDTQVTIYQNGARLATTNISGMNRAEGPLFIGARGSVGKGDTFFQGWIDEVAVYKRVLTDDEIKAIYQAYMIGKPITPFTGPQVVDISVPKLLYSLGETTTATVVIKNFGNDKSVGVLHTRAVHLLDTSRELPTRALSFGPQEVVALSIPVTFTSEDYGCELDSRISSAGRPGYEAKTVFSVSDSVWKVGIGGAVHPAEIGSMSDSDIAAQVQMVKASYANWIEMFFWAPDDWGDMTPQNDWWYSGQEGYYMRRDSIKSLIDQAHAYGIKMITYGKCVAGGPPAFETMRLHPDWFLKDIDGRPQHFYNQTDLDNWDNREGRLNGTYTPQMEWLYLNPDFYQTAPLRWGIDQIIGSAKEFGWDGVRFDGQFTVANDDVSTFNMRRLKELVWKQDPSFVFGFNYAYAPENYGGVTHEMQEGMAGGGMWLQEGIGEWKYTDGQSYSSWNQFATNELKVAKEIQALGGSYHCIYSLKPDTISEYKLIYGLISGGHSVYSTHESVPGSPDWGKFMTRWSAFLWDHRLHAMQNPARRISVTSPAPVYWQPLAQEYVESAHRKFWVIHLVNQSTTDQIFKTDATTVPDPVDDIKLDLRPDTGEHITRVELVRPDVEPFDQVLTPSGDAGSTVTVPRLKVWAMVVVQLQGDYDMPAAPPRFTAAPDMAKVIAARQAESGAGGGGVTDPLHPSTTVPLGPGEQIWKTDQGFNSVPADVVTDKDAIGGLAQRAWSGGGYMGRSWIGPFTPGRYRISAHLKWSGADALTENLNMSIYLITEHTDITNYRISLRDPASEGHTPGIYQNYTVDVDMKYGGYLHCVISSETAFNSPGDIVLLDYIKTSTVSTYSDAQMAQYAKPLDRPAGLGVPNGASPTKVFEARGMFWQQYDVAKTIDCTTAYGPPLTYKELYAYDAVVFTNFDFDAFYQLRKLYMDYVNDGGRIVILGGADTLRANLHDTYWEAMLPVKLGSEGSLLPCEPPLSLGDSAGAPYADSPLLFWRHDVTPTPDAQVLAYAGNQPIITRRKVGKGEIIVFSGTVCGGAEQAGKPFWESAEWPALLKRMVYQ